MLEKIERGNCLYRNAEKQRRTGFLIYASQPPALDLITLASQAILQKLPADHRPKAAFW